MPVDEIVLPETKPETEWILGKPVQKVSPTTRHSFVQTKWLLVLATSYGERAQVGAEWRFRLAPPGEVLRPLVPDVAFVWTDRFRGMTLEEADVPAFAPNVAIEILSRDDRAIVVLHKIDVYLRAGCELVIITDPYARTVRLIDPGGQRLLRESETIEHPALPGFALGVTELFAAMELPR